MRKPGEKTAREISEVAQYKFNVALLYVKYKDRTNRALGIYDITLFNFHKLRDQKELEIAEKDSNIKTHPTDIKKKVVWTDHYNLM